MPLQLAGCFPAFSCPDDDLTRIFAFRRDVLGRHCRQTPDGWVVTEFLPEVPWAKRHNTINCAAGHHLLEGRWMHDPAPLDQYAGFWFGGGGEPRQYSTFLAEATRARCLVGGDWTVALALLDRLAANWRAWAASNRHASGLFWSNDDRDGSEFSISGPGLRPTLNTYMLADARAIADLAARAGRQDLVAEFAGEADRLDALMQRLWDPGLGFFTAIPMDGAKSGAGIPDALRHAEPAWDRAADPAHRVRELFGYLPWTFACAGQADPAAWRQLADPQGFAGACGPTTAERRHPRFGAAHDHECLWNGPSWPFATSLMLMGLANHLRDGTADAVGRGDFLAWMRTYARSQHRREADGREIPWIDENLDPDTGAWLARERLQALGRGDRERGVDYLHSTFCDLVITGLCGLVPRADGVVELDPLLPDDAWEWFALEDVRYHGHRLDIRWDRHGRHFGAGHGLRVLCDGQPLLRSERLGPACAPLPGQRLGRTSPWRKHPASPVLDPALGTCFDPAVAAEDGQLRMWVSWRPQAALALSESTDGVAWTRPEIVLGPDPASGWENHVNRGTLVKRDGVHHLWYTGQSDSGSWIGHAVSRDGGRTFTRRAKPVLSPERPWEGVALMSPHVLWDSRRNVFRMWYCGGAQYEPDVIGYAESPDGIAWTRHGNRPVVVADRRFPCEMHKVAGPWVVEHDGWWLLFYIGFADVDRASICLARSRDGITGWERHPANPIISPDAGAWDGEACYKPSALRTADGRWRLWYNGRTKSLELIGLAELDRDPAW